MDDGHKADYGFILNTYSFTIDEVNMLSTVLLNNFNLKITIQIKKNGPVLYISSKSMDLFRTLVRPYFHNSMLYKLNNNNNKIMDIPSLNSIILLFSSVYMEYYELQDLYLLALLPSFRSCYPPKVRSAQRIGPHNFNILSILIGSMLADAYAEKHGNGTRICFQQEEFNSSYLLWFHEFLSERNYCNKTIPKITTRIGKQGKLRYLSRFKTYTYSNLNWIHENFYKENKKVVPQNISDFLSPIALAVWIQDDGARVSSGCTKKLLQIILHMKK